MTKVLSGIFYQLAPSKDELKEYSRKWWLAVLSLTAFTLLVVASLIGMSLVSHSGVGIYVVLGTLCIGIGILFTSAYLRTRYQNTDLVTKGNIFHFALVFLIFAVIFFPFGFIIYPSDPIGFGVIVLAGGFILSLLVLMAYEGYPRLKERGSPGVLTTSGLLIVLALVYMTVISYWIVPYNPFSINIGGIREPPNPDFPLGTTSLGQDMLSRVVAGGATMLQVAVLSVIVCFFVGVPLGLLSSYKGGNFDRGMGLIMDSLFAFPGLVLAIAISAMLGPGIVNMAIAIAVVYIPSYFRIIRSQVFTVKELPYVEAAIIMGAKDREILLRYILPNVLPSVVVIMSINFADAVLTAAGLTFVGLGLPIDIADWGWDLTLGFEVIIVGSWWVSAFPGLMIVLLALGFTLTGEGLNEILTPKLRE
ncbi:MAG: ABC transporter permease [Candidatus Thorarchaeota archaeon]